MVHRTSCPSFGKLTGSTLDKLQFHSSGNGNQMKYFIGSLVISPKKVLLWLGMPFPNYKTHLMFTDLDYNLCCCSKLMIPCTKFTNSQAQTTKGFFKKKKIKEFK